jgi:hypothetical protein
MIVGITLLLVGIVSIYCAVTCLGYKIPPPTHNNGFKDHAVKKYI